MGGYQILIHRVLGEITGQEQSTTWNFRESMMNSWKIPSWSQEQGRACPTIMKTLRYVVPWWYPAFLRLLVPPLVKGAFLAKIEGVFSSGNWASPWPLWKLFIFLGHYEILGIDKVHTPLPRLRPIQKLRLGDTIAIKALYRLSCSCFRYDTVSRRPSRIQPLKWPILKQNPSIFGWDMTQNI